MQIEKVNYKIKWNKFQVGTSFFIPCLNPQKAWKRVLQVLSKRKVKAVHKIVIEDGVRGIRVWRVTTSL